MPPSQRQIVFTDLPKNGFMYKDIFGVLYNDGFDDPNWQVNVHDGHISLYKKYTFITIQRGI